MADAHSECRSWRSIADLLTAKPGAPAALIGAPLNEKSLTPGRCDLGPKVFRDTLRRFSVYDLETGADLSAMSIFDGGDLPLKTMTPEESFGPIRDAAAKISSVHKLTIIVGGNNAVTRPGVRALADVVDRVGLITLDAHFDLRDTDCGLNNGNPVRALIRDGLPGGNIVQIGLAPFANTKRAHDFAQAQGIAVRTRADVRARGILDVVDDALARLGPKVDRIYVDFDIDVVDRAECPGAPGARPGGISSTEFFMAARRIAGHPKVAAVDLTEFDPSLDVSDTAALLAGRWACEILAGFASRD